MYLRDYRFQYMEFMWHPYAACSGRTKYSSARLSLKQRLDVASVTVTAAWNAQRFWL